MIRIVVGVGRRLVVLVCGRNTAANAVFGIQFNKPMDPGSANPLNAQGANPQYVYLYDNTAGTYVTTTISFSSDLTTVFLKPTANLTASHSFQMCSYYMTDLSGNAQTNFCENFNSGTGPVTTGPSVVQVSPPAAATGGGTNSPVQILFSEAIDGASLAGVTLKQGSSVIPTTTSLYDGDQGVQLLPLTPLTPNTTYTINVAGVLDITGNAQTSFPSQSFTTGTGIDLQAPTWVSATCTVTPCSGATNVPDGTTIVVVFSKAMDPASFDPNNSFTLRTAANVVVPATLAFSAGDTTVTLTPTAPLTGGGATYFMEISYQAALSDWAGNHVSNGNFFSFTTH